MLMKIRPGCVVALMLWSVTVAQAAGPVSGLVLAVNPWQAEDASSSVTVELDGRSVSLELRGLHTAI